MDQSIFLGKFKEEGTESDDNEELIECYEVILSESSRQQVKEEIIEEKSEQKSEILSIEFCCKKCRKSFKTKEHLDSHVCTVCSICGQVLGDSWKLKRHLLNHNRAIKKEVKNFYCNKCSRSYKSKRSFQRHNCEHICFSCEEKFDRKWMLTSHRKICSNGSSLTCSNCDRNFSRLIFYNRHRCYGKDQFFECDYCGNNLKSKRTMKDHLRKVHKAGPKLFNKDYNSNNRKTTISLNESPIKSPMKTFEDSNENQVEIDDLKCPLCHEVVADVQNLISHLALNHLEQRKNSTHQENAEKISLSVKNEHQKEEDEWLLCYICGKFILEKNVAMHYMKVHKL